MIRVILCIYLVFVSYNMFACVMPSGGKEIDALVKVEHLGGKVFRITAPQEIKTLALNYGADFTLKYHKADNSNTYQYTEHEKELEINKKGALFEAIIDIDPIKDFTPFVTVFWYPERCCFCGAVGHSKDLVF